MACSSNIVLVSSDGDTYQVNCDVAKVFRTLETMMENLGALTDEPIPLPNVTSKILGKIVAWAEEHVRSQTPPPPPPVSQTSQNDTIVPIQPQMQPRVPKRIMPSAIVEPTVWEQQFLDKNKLELYDLLLAANYLDAKRLMTILCSAVASKIKGKDPAEIRRTFRASEPTSDDTMSIDSDVISLNENNTEDSTNDNTQDR